VGWADPSVPWPTFSVGQGDPLHLEDHITDYPATLEYVVRYPQDTVPQACDPTLAQVGATPV